MDEDLSGLPEPLDPHVAVPAWPQFMRGCVRYRLCLPKSPSAQLLRARLAPAPRRKPPVGGDGGGEEGREEGGRRGAHVLHESLAEASPHETIERTHAARRRRRVAVGMEAWRGRTTGVGIRRRQWGA
jgi:hypothetical protein